MNLHAPQSYEASTELDQIAAVRHQIIGPREGKPSIGIVQDTLVGVYRLTKNDNKFTRREYMNLMMYNKGFEGLPKATAEVGVAGVAGSRWSGHQVVSSLLPPVNMDMGNKSFDDDPRPQNKVKIVEGQVINGTLDKDVFSKTGKGIIHMSYNDYGPETTVDMIDSMQTTIESFLVYNGFSVGISDMIADDKTRQQMEEVIQARKKEVNELNLQVHLDLFDNNTGKPNQEEFEARVFAALNKATKEAGDFGQLALADENRLVAMVKAGSKGGPINIAQMIACVGQQNIEGRRIPYGFSDRTLPHYKKYDDGPEARGFIGHSFIGGLTPQEFFFHAMSGREGLIDTAVKSVTGDTPIIIIENGEAKRVEIGPWIDAQLKTAPPGNVEQYDESQANLELLNITHDVTIPTLDAEGNMSWGKITAITRHDPGTKIYQIKTQSGRDVIVSAGKSLLIWNNTTSKFEQTPTVNAKIGDYVPVVMKLPEPPVIQTEVHLSKYLPKTKYVYGSDFITARNMMNNAIGTDRIQIPRGWWNKHNGNEFILPYPSKARLQRVQVRSNLSRIKSGYVYPYAASREVSKTPEIFQLNNENGIFLGLFLAEGNVDINSGYVQITNNDKKIREFVQNWFNKNEIKSRESIKVNEVGTSSSIRGNSSILAQFLDAFVGHGAENKYIPSEAFIAPEEFVIGILNGYFSGDGCITQNTISSSSVSKRLTNGISLLCNRIGIFAKLRKIQLKHNNFGSKNILPSYVIDIRSKWAKIFSQKIQMIHDEKQQKLHKISTSFEHRNYPSFKDVVLDAIIEINEMTPEKYPKLYDLTVPSTYNFVIENALGQADTADTGYIQRQLVKAMEDLTVQHDGTVRDANMNIVQYHYGEDGLNATKIEGTSISYVKLSEADIVRDFGLQKVDFTTVLEDGVQTEDYKTTPQVKEYVKQILEDRKMIVEGMFASGRQGSVFGPMNLERVITNVKVRFGLKNTADTKTDLTPLYVLQGIEKLITRTQAYHRLWCALIRFHFAPHKIIVKERFTKAAFDALLELCVVKDWKAWSLPGELVGIIAAQSIGEPCTQLTLNSVDWDTEILIAKNGHIITPMIGEFIDNYYKDLIAKNKDDPRIQYLPNDQVYIELNDGNDWQAISPDENGTIQWTKLEAITFHPVINADGTNTILEVELESGRIVKATKARSFLTRGSNDELVDTNGSDLKIGDEIPIANTLALEQLGLITEINLREITEINPVTNKDEPVFPATKFMYGTDVSTAIACMKEADEQNTTYWFAKNQGKVFTVPYKRSDTFRDAMAGRNSNEFKIGHIYPKRTRPDVSHIPETIALTEEFGFFVGAYVAEGSSNTTQVCVTNNDLEYLAKVRGLMDKWNIGTHTTSEDREAAVSGIKGHTTTLVIHSTILSKMMGALFGKVSYKKTLPDWVLQAPDEFIHGFMDAYISGDGTVCLRSGVISASSVSKQLIDRLMAVLARYGIFTTTSSYTPELQNFKSVARQYTIDIPAKYSKVFANTFTLTLANKQERLTKHFIENTKKRNCKRESVNDVIWDKVKKITCIPPLHDKVYDVTVSGTKNFMTINNICVKDTFHLAGYSAKSNVTRGVPRIKELLKVTENPKAIALTVYLKPEFRGNKDKVREVTQDLELTLLRDITVKTGIFFDPADNTTVVSEDKELIDFYHLFETREEGAVAEEEATEAETEGGDSKKWSSWLLRLELDREKMFNKNINMDDISYALNHAFGKNFNASAVNLIYSDFNSKKLIMRIRLGKEDKTLGFGDDLAGLKKFQNKILNSIVIRGVPGIRSATFRKHADLLEHVGGEYKPIEQYVIDTDGTNFLEVMNHPAVDGTRLYSTHVHDIYQNLGVEAARACLISELFGLFEEAGVNYRHLGILCDVMTRNGRLMSIDRYGINKMDNGPLAKASFEETGSILLKAALFGEVDPITGVSANIMMGQSIRGGTAFSHILLDETAQERLLQGLPPVEETDESNEEEEGVDLTQEMIDAELYEDPNDACATTQLRMNISMPTDVPLLDEPEGELIVLEAS